KLVTNSTFMSPPSKSKCHYSITPFLGFPPGVTQGQLTPLKTGAACRVLRRRRVVVWFVMFHLDTLALHTCTAAYRTSPDHSVHRLVHLDSRSPIDCAGTSLNQ